MKPNKIKEFRLKQEFTQEEMAEALHVSQNAYSLVENGRTRLIDIERIILISQKLCVSPWELGLFDELISFFPYSKGEFLTRINTLTSTVDNQELINNLLAEIQINNNQIEKTAIQNEQLLILLAAKK